MPQSENANFYWHGYRECGGGDLHHFAEQIPGGYVPERRVGQEVLWHPFPHGLSYRQGPGENEGSILWAPEVVWPGLVRHYQPHRGGGVHVKAANGADIPRGAPRRREFQQMLHEVVRDIVAHVGMHLGPFHEAHDHQQRPDVEPYGTAASLVSHLEVELLGKWLGIRVLVVPHAVRHA